MKIKNILDNKGSKLVTIGPQNTLHEALCALIDNKVGALLVKKDSGGLIGIITERDLMREMYNSGSLGEKKLEEIMTRDISTATPEDEIEYVMNAMTEGRFRHLPVIQDDELVGIISIGDVVKAQLHQAKNQVTHLMDYIAGPGLS